MMSIFSELHQEGRTVVLVTHDDAVANYAAREVRLEDGRLASDRLRNAAATWEQPV